jgi:hypothetical protein
MLRPLTQFEIGYRQLLTWKTEEHLLCENSIHLFGCNDYDFATWSIGKWHQSHYKENTWCDWGSPRYKGSTVGFFSLRRREYTHGFLLCPLPTEAAGLLGTDFLEKAGAKIDLECGTMSHTDIGRVPRAFGVPHAKHTALTVFAEGKAGRSPQLSQQETQRTDEQLSAGPRPEIITHQSRTWLVRATENIAVAPWCRQIVVGKLESERGKASLHSSVWSPLTFL